MEPRMRPRQKGQQFSSSDLEAYLVAFGDDHQPLKETVRALDEIVTDYIIETCHAASLSASYSRRSKIKVDDFKFVLRRDNVKLGRVLELHSMQREIKTKKRMFEVDEKRLGRDAASKELKGALRAATTDKKLNTTISGGGKDSKSNADKHNSISSNPILHTNGDDLNDAIVNGLLDDGDDLGSDLDDDDTSVTRGGPKKRQRIV